MCMSLSDPDLIADINEAEVRRAHQHRLGKVTIGEIVDELESRGAVIKRCDRYIEILVLEDPEV
jgi:hypothetical protein